MSKKDYQAIAAIIRESKTAMDVARGIAAYAAQENTRFDRDRFMIAAGVKR